MQIHSFLSNSLYNSQQRERGRGGGERERERNCKERKRVENLQKFSVSHRQINPESPSAVYGRLHEV